MTAVCDTPLVVTEALLDLIFRKSDGTGTHPLDHRALAVAQECRALIHSGRVRIDGQLCEDPYADYRKVLFFR